MFIQCIFTADIVWFVLFLHAHAFTLDSMYSVNPVNKAGKSTGALTWINSHFHILLGLLWKSGELISQFLRQAATAARCEQLDEQSRHQGGLDDQDYPKMLQGTMYYIVVLPLRNKTT